MRSSLVSLFLLALLSNGAALASPPPLADKVVEHLEFMGYDVSVDEEVIRAIHSQNLNLVIQDFRGGMLAIAYFGGSDYGKTHRIEWMELVNRLNMEAAAARYYIDDDGDLAIEGYYPGEYSKKSFSAFLDAFNLESSNLSEVADEFERYVE